MDWIVQENMVDVFPNICIAYRIGILSTLPITSCGAERSFSVLKRIQNMYRSTMFDDRLSSLTRECNPLVYQSR